MPELPNTITTRLQELVSKDKNANQQRLEALIECLTNAQHEFQSGIKDWKNEIDNVHHKQDISTVLHHDVYYSLSWLVKQLIETDEEARAIYTAALTKMLNLVNFLPVKKLVELIIDNSKFEEDMEGYAEEDVEENIEDNIKVDIKYEITNFDLGRIAGLQSIASSNVLYEKHVTLEDWKSIINYAYDLVYEEGGLEQSCHLLHDLIKKASISPLKKELGNYLWEIINEIKLKDSQDLLYYLACLVYFPNILNEGIEPRFNLLDLDKLEALAKILRNQRHSQLDGLPLIWKFLLDAFLSRNCLKSLTEYNFGRFWKVCVNDNIFVSHRIKNKLVGLLALQHVLPLLNANQFPLIFTKNLIIALMDIHVDDNKSKEIVDQTFQKLVKALSLHPNAAWALVSRLHNFSLDKRSNDKKIRKQLIEQVMKGTGRIDISAYINYLIKVFNSNEKLYDFTPEDAQLWAIHQMQVIMRDHNVQNFEKVLKYAISFFTLHSFFNFSVPDPTSSLVILHEKPKCQVDNNVHELAQSKLQAILKDTLQMTLDKNGNISKGGNYLGNMYKGSPWIKWDLELIEELHNKPQLILVNPLALERQQLLEKAKQLLARIEDRVKIIDDSDSIELSVVSGFDLLIHYLILFLHLPNNSIFESINDVIECYNELYHSEEIKKDKRKRTDNMDPIDKFIKLLISFLNGTNSLVKDVAGVVFERITPKFQFSTIQLIFNCLSNAEDDTANLIDDEDKYDKDYKPKKEKEDNDEKEDKKYKADDVDEGVLEEYELNDEFSSSYLLLDFTSDAESSFQNKKMKFSNEPASENPDENSNTDEVNDEKNQTIRNFRSRLVDWISVYIVRQNSNPLTLYTINPLLFYIYENISNKNNHASVVKASKILSIDINKIEFDNNFDMEEIESILINAHQLTRQHLPTKDSHDIGKDCHAVLRTFIQLIVEMDTDRFDECLSDLYAETLDVFATDRDSNIKTEIFFDLMTVSPKHGWPIGIKVVQYLDAEDKKWGLRVIKASEILDKLMVSSINKRYYNEEHLTTFLYYIRIKLSGIIKSVNRGESGIIKADHLRDLLKIPEKLRGYLESHGRSHDYNYFESEIFLTLCDRLLTTPHYGDHATLRDYVYRVTNKRFDGPINPPRSVTSGSRARTRSN